MHTPENTATARTAQPEPHKRSLFISREEVARALGIGRTTVWKLTKDAAKGRGTFPQPVHFGARCTRWNRAQIEAWAAEVSGIPTSTTGAA